MRDAAMSSSLAHASRSSASHATRSPMGSVTMDRSNNGWVLSNKQWSIFNGYPVSMAINFIPYRCFVQFCGIQPAGFCQPAMCDDRTVKPCGSQATAWTLPTNSNEDFSKIKSKFKQRDMGIVPTQNYYFTNIIPARDPKHVGGVRG